jgi:hypothetical protein
MGFVWSNTASAQETVCSIRYTYDKAGHRTKREYKCEVPPGPGTPSPWLNPGGVIRSVYPVPTSGVFHVEFSTAISSAYLYITDINGAHIMDRTISQQTNIVSFDLTPYAPGNYILTGIFGNEMESYPVTKQ